jgi:uncharacterized lipoprotein YddW (UPF0748 family)
MKCLPQLAIVVAFVLPLAGCGKQVFTGKREARGVWMSRFEYTNDSTRTDPEQSKQRIREVFEQARRAKFNMIIFQVRGNGDAFYKSAHEPWSQRLTGSLGQDPGWDPLQFAIDEAHRLGLELHAWLNTFPIWRGKTSPPESTPRSMYLEHPEWLVCDKDGKPMPLSDHYVNISPGVPAARQHVLNVVMDIVEKYDVDGIHFDYIRYPEESTTRGYSHDSISVARFNSIEGNPKRLAWDHWQREQINQFVADAYNGIMQRKPWVKMSASVIGKYRGTGWTAYHAVYQDPRNWMELGKIDFIVPMVYWQREHPTHPFIPLITEWHDRVAYDRHVVPGLSAGLQQRFGWEELSAEIEAVRKRGLPGVVFFSAAGLRRAWEILGLDEFPYWSNTPRFPWKDSIPPSPPHNVQAVKKETAVIVQWEAPSTDEPLIYNVYRAPTPNFSRDDVANLLFITPRNATRFVDTKPLDGTVYYAVSALDRLGNESALSDPVHVQQVANRTTAPGAYLSQQ